MQIRIMFPTLVILSLLGLVMGTCMATSSWTVKTGRSLTEPGTTIPTENRPCVDCHTFEFMERALQDINKAAYNLDFRAERLLLQTEDRTLCDCTGCDVRSRLD